MEATAEYLWPLIILSVLASFFRWAITKKDLTFQHSLLIFFGGLAAGVTMAMVFENVFEVGKIKIIVAVVSFCSKEVGEFLIEYVPKKLREKYGSNKNDKLD